MSLPKPYYDKDGITIYNADCLRLLPELTQPIDAILMDPPYASGARTEANKASSGAMVRGQRWAAKPIENDQMTTAGFVWLIRELLLESKRLMTPSASVLSFIDWRQWPNLVGAVESANMRVNSMVVWDKLSMGLGNGFRAQHELILYATLGTAEPDDKGTANVIKCYEDCPSIVENSRDNNSDHPSPKPVGLMGKLLKVVTGEGETVLDPFMGAGSTLVAAKQLGRKAVGIEIEEKYCEIAVHRLAQEVMAF